MKKTCNSRLAKEGKAKAFSILCGYAGRDLIPFCDNLGRCWLLIGWNKKRISKEEYFTLKEAGL